MQILDGGRHRGVQHAPALPEARVGHVVSQRVLEGPYDRAPTASHLTRNCRAAVQRSAQARHRAKLALELRRGPRDRLSDPEEAGDRLSAVAPCRGAKQNGEDRRPGS